MAYRHKPLSLNPADATDYEVPITAANSAPSGVGTVHATFAPQSDGEVSKVRRGPKKVLISARFSGTDATNANWLCAYWNYNPDTEQWHCSGRFNLVGYANLSTTLGQMAVLEHNPNARYAYLEVVSGVSANQVIELTIDAQEW